MPSPHPLPRGLRWCTCDLGSPAGLDAAHRLLSDNPGPDYAFAYDPEHLRWALLPPGFNPALHLGVRHTATGELVGLIAAAPLTLRVEEQRLRAAAVNFLVVDRRFRVRHLAPLLIKELGRRCLAAGLEAAVFTSGPAIPGAFTKARYHHRPLRPAALVELGMLDRPPGWSNDALEARYALPGAPRTRGLRPMEPRDVPACTRLLAESLGRFALAPVLTEAELAHLLLPRPGVVQSFVVERSGREGEISDLVSFFLLACHASGAGREGPVETAYALYDVARETARAELMRDALILARQAGALMFNALDIGANAALFGPLDFLEGTGTLDYHLRGGPVPRLTPGDLGLVLP